MEIVRLTSASLYETVNKMLPMDPKRPIRMSRIKSIFVGINQPPKGSVANPNNPLTKVKKHAIFQTLSPHKVSFLMSIQTIANPTQKMMGQI